MERHKNFEKASTKNGETLAGLSASLSAVTHGTSFPDDDAVPHRSYDSIFTTSIHHPFIE